VSEARSTTGQSAFPTALPDVTVGSAEAASGQAPGNMNDRPTNILLIEDDPTYAKLLRTCLDRHASGFRFQLELASSLKAGLARIAGGGIDIILSDLGLPDSQELDTLKRLHKRAGDIPIIVLSGVDDPALEMQAIHLGAEEYLVKGEVERKLIVRSIRYALERRRVNAELRQAQENYRSIYENTLEGIFQTTMEGKYLTANPGLARIYGYDSPEELISSMTDIAGSLYVRPGRREEFIRLMRWHQVVTNFESQVFRKDGQVIWIAENVRAVRDRNGNFAYYEGTVTDITERKEAELRLKESEALYHSLVEAIPQNIFRKDLMERFTFANQRFCASIGRPLDQILSLIHV
jgi:PAS domain S-box-containing protein